MMEPMQRRHTRRRSLGALAPAAGGQLTDPAVRTQGAELLRAAKEAESAAAEALAEAATAG